MAGDPKEGKSVFSSIQRRVEEVRRGVPYARAVHLNMQEMEDLVAYVEQRFHFRLPCGCEIEWSDEGNKGWTFCPTHLGIR